MRVGRASMDAIEAHARDSYPDECCGWLVGLADGSEKVVRMRNYQDEAHARDPDRYPRTARTAYYPHPDDLLAAYRLAEQPGHRLLAMYHSHPDHDAYFSEEDVRQAAPDGEPHYPDALQLVVSVRAGEIGEVKAFVWSAHRAAFEPVPIQID